MSNWENEKEHVIQYKQASCMPQGKKWNHKSEINYMISEERTTIRN